MKCVSLDLDGTLLDSNHQISIEDQKVIQQMKEKGIEVIINTGRAYKDVIKIQAVQRINCPIFCLNGSIMFSETGELLYETSLSFELFHEFLPMLKKLGVGILVYTNQGGMPATLPQLRGKTNEEILQMFQHYDYEKIPEMKNIRIYKMVAWVDENSLNKIDIVKNKIQHIPSISYSSSFPNNLEITTKDAQKGKAIKRYEQIKNVEFDELYAFGDGGNDLSQFEVATASVAMENAPEDIKKQATFVTKSNDDSGVSYAIKHLLKLL
ncbi:HAD family hydrolase [Bacillus sp. Marseille-P3661]|uniref:HAD family hydrolase n=1 Tax=Bacillus sp. Marseille-P3661 TaxID=1936234 RepID=UPI000C841692|nr:HAD family hydrolase [Bacillus sp. Marseille-P3661]